MLAHNSPPLPSSHQDVSANQHGLRAKDGIRRDLPIQKAHRSIRARAEVPPTSQLLRPGSKPRPATVVSPRDDRTTSQFGASRYPQRAEPDNEPRRSRPATQMCRLPREKLQRSATKPRQSVYGSIDFDPVPLM